MAISFLYKYEQMRDITDDEWTQIREEVVKAYNLVSTSIYIACGDKEKVGHWTSLFPPPPCRDNGTSIAGWVVDGKCLAFGGGTDRSLRSEAFILTQKVQSTPQANGVFTDGLAYDLLVRYCILIVHNAAKGAYEFKTDGRFVEERDIEAYWINSAHALAEAVQHDISIPFLTSKKGIWNRPLLIPLDWKQSVVGVDDSFF